MSEREFARLLTEAVYTIKARENLTLRVVQDELGYTLSRKGGSCIEYWRRGNVPGDVPVLEKLTLELTQRAGYDEEWARNFLIHGRHPDPQQVCLDVFPVLQAMTVAVPQVRSASGRVTELDTAASTLKSANGQSSPVAELELSWVMVQRFMARELGRIWRVVPKLQLFFGLLVVVCMVSVYRNWDDLHNMLFPYMNQGWAVRAQENDDINAILVNGRLLDAVHSKYDMNWKIIEPLLASDEPNTVTFLNINGSGYSLWDFSLMYDDSLVWGDSGQGLNMFDFGYSQTLQLSPGGMFEFVEWEETDEPLAGVWEAKINAADFALILINQQPAAVGYKSSFGVFDWFDVTPYLSAEQMNEVAVIVWSDRGNGFWDIELRRDGDVVWEDSGQRGAQKTGEVFYSRFFIDEIGEIVEKD